ncbi:response regulator transcription factor [Kribbella sp. NPDC026611]|uniref:response regulator transcription factor n=1 Tax=Kribbella sp. NPDC026611 TaxID=3154911 RepID=UPI0033E1DFD9
MRALVVEDEVRLAAGLRNGLEAEGYAVDVALTGTDGLWFAREHGYDVVLLDLMLPEIDGFEICATLRAERVWTPILMLTARDADNDQVRALDTGADDYLTKPFSYAVLIARLRALVRRGAAERPVILEAGGLRLDPASRRAWLADAELVLTARELALLEFLIRRSGQVVSKRTILEHVWDYDFEGDPNIVEVYIRRLRTKLGPAAITTLRGAGYRLTD